MDPPYDCLSITTVLTAVFPEKRQLLITPIVKVEDEELLPTVKPPPRLPEFPMKLQSVTVKPV
jgi:hypothetical protein